MNKRRHIIYRTVTDGLCVVTYCGRQFWTRDHVAERDSRTCKQCLKQHIRLMATTAKPVAVFKIGQ